MYYYFHYFIIIIIQLPVTRYSQQPHVLTVLWFLSGMFGMKSMTEYIRFDLCML